MRSRKCQSGGPQTKWAQFSESQLQSIFHRKQPFIDAVLVAAMSREELIRGIEGEHLIKMRGRQVNSD